MWRSVALHQSRGVAIRGMLGRLENMIEHSSCKLSKHSACAKLNYNSILLFWDWLELFQVQEPTDGNSVIVLNVKTGFLSCSVMWASGWLAFKQALRKLFGQDGRNRCLVSRTSDLQAPLKVRPPATLQVPSNTSKPLTSADTSLLFNEKRQAQTADLKIWMMSHGWWLPPEDLLRFFAYGLFLRGVNMTTAWLVLMQICQNPALRATAWNRDTVKHADRMTVLARPCSLWRFARVKGSKRAFGLELWEKNWHASSVRAEAAAVVVVVVVVIIVVVVVVVVVVVAVAVAVVVVVVGVVVVVV